MSHIRTRGRILVLIGQAVSLVSLLCSPGAHAQTVIQNSALPIQVAARPQSAAAGTPVTLEGAATPYGNEHFVAVTVTPPNGAAKSIRSSISAVGAFNVFFLETEELGTYQVEAKGPDGRGLARTTFTIVSSGQANDSVGRQSQAALQVAARHLARFGAMIDALPLSPPQLATQKKIAALQQQIEQVRPLVESVIPLLDELSQARSKVGDPRLRGRLNRMQHDLDEYADEARAEIPRLDERLSAYTQENLVCDQVDHVTEGFKFLSVLLNLVARPFDILLNFAKDVDADAASNLLSNSTAQLGVSTATKNINSLLNTPAKDPTGKPWVSRPKQLLSGLPSFAADLSAYISEQVFSSYCERFSGTIEGTMTAEFEHKAKPWWKYSFDIKGRVVLRYPKVTPSATPVRMTGQMEGLGTNFKVWDDALRVLSPELMQGSIQAHWHVMPWLSSPISGALLGNAIKEGSVFAAQVPNAFFFPIEGDLLGDQLTLRLGAKQIDFEDKTADSYYFVVSPLTLLHPMVGFALPFKGARFAIGRAMNDEPAHFQVKVSGKDLSVEREFVSKHGKGEAKGNYALKLRACNPGCSGATAPSEPPKM